MDNKIINTEDRFAYAGTAPFINYYLFLAIKEYLNSAKDFDRASDKVLEVNARAFKLRTRAIERHDYNSDKIQKLAEEQADIWNEIFDNQFDLPVDIFTTNLQPKLKEFYSTSKRVMKLVIDAIKNNDESSIYFYYKVAYKIVHMPKEAIERSIIKSFKRERLGMPAYVLWETVDNYNYREDYEPTTFPGVALIVDNGDKNTIYNPVANRSVDLGTIAHAIIEYLRVVPLSYWNFADILTRILHRQEAFNLYFDPEENNDNQEDF